MKLTFVYNANSGTVNAWLDIGHKLIRPDTYACNLCALTHGVLREREEWKRFREASDVDLEFLHKDEFEKQHGRQDFDYPVILLSEGEGPFELALSKEQIDGMSDLEALIRALPTA